MIGLDPHFVVIDQAACWLLCTLALAGCTLRETREVFSAVERANR